MSSSQATRATPRGALLKKALKNKVRAFLRKSRRTTVRAFFSYEPADLVRALREIGIRSGDSVMFHSAFADDQGFRGSIETLIDTFRESVGPDGNLLMVSLAYRGAALDYLPTLKQFDVR